jgi:hypothetical protein
LKSSPLGLINYEISHAKSAMIEDRNTLLEVEAYLNQIVHPFGFLMVEGNENKKLIDLKSNF